MKKSRKIGLLAAAASLLLAGGYGLSILKGASSSVDPSRLAVVEHGTMLRSVVATGKIEPITKVEIKSKANGIIERLHVDVDQIVQPGQVLAELDRENPTARLREARANLQAAEAAHEAAIAQLKKNEIEAQSPDVEFARRNSARAQQLFDQKLVSQSNLDDAKSALADFLKFKPEINSIKKVRTQFAFAFQNPRAAAFAEKTTFLGLRRAGLPEE